MPDIFIRVVDTYDGAGIRRAKQDVRELAAEIERLPKGAVAQAGAAIQAGPQGVQAIAAAQVSQFQGISAAANQASAQVNVSVNTIGGAASASSAKLAKLKEDLEAIENTAKNSPFFNPRTGQGSSRGLAAPLQAKADEIRGQIAEIESQIEAGGLDRWQRVQARMASKSVGMEDARKKKEELEQDRFEKATASWTAQVSAAGAGRVRPGEESEAAMHRGQLEDKARDQRDLQQEESARRRAMNDNRRDSMNDLMVGGMMSAAGAAVLSPVGFGLKQFGELQRTQVGLQAVEGANAPNVMAQAKTDALNVFGASYRDLINFESQLRQVGETTEDARKNTLALSDVIAGTGGNADKFGRVLNNLAQVDAQGHLTDRDLRDFEVNLIPMTQFLARVKGVDQSAVADMVSKKEISSADVHASLALMAQDPRYKGRSAAMENNTLPGQIEKLNEQWERTGELIGGSVAPALTKVLNIGNGFLQWVNQHPSIAAAGAYGAVGVGGALALGGVAKMAQGSLGMAAQAFPGLGNLPILGKLLERGSSPVNPLFVENVGGGLGGGVSGAAGAAGAGNAAGAVGAARPWWLPGAGEMAVGGAVGLAAGLGAYDDRSTTGDPNALWNSAATGAAAAAAAMFVPEAAIPIAIVAGFRAVFNELVNVPEENKNPGEATPEELNQPKTDSPASFLQRAADEEKKIKDLQKQRDDLANTQDISFGEGGIQGQLENKARREKIADLDRDIALEKLNAKGSRIDATRFTGPKGTLENAEQMKQREMDAWIQANVPGYALGPNAKSGDSGAVSNRRHQEGIRVMGVKDHPNLCQTVTLLLPPHGEIKGMAQDFRNATS